MVSKFIEIAKMRFDGPRYTDNKLDILAMKELINLQDVLYQSLERHNSKEYDSDVKITSDEKVKYAIYLANLEPGSTVASIQVKSDDSGNIFDHVPAHEEVKNRMGEIVDVIAAAEEGRRFPDDSDKDLIRTLKKLGNSLPPDCRMELCTPRQSWVQLTPKSKERLQNALTSPYTDDVSIKGVVLEANVKTRKFTIWPNEQENIKVDFNLDQEDQITTALKEHSRLELWLKGIGRFNSDGKMERISEVSDIRLLETDDNAFDVNAEPIWESAILFQCCFSFLEHGSSLEHFEA